MKADGQWEKKAAVRRPFTVKNCDASAMSKKNFYELLCRGPRCTQGALCEDIHCVQVSLIRRSSLDAWLHTVALLRLIALCIHYWIETFAARMAR